MNGDERIYRIYAWDRLKKILQDKTDALVPTNKWDDPFENFILGCKAVHEGKETDLSSVHDSWYGLCWTFKDESDGLWRTYTNQHQKTAVKVSTTVDKLFNNFYDFGNHVHALSFFIGKVEYSDKSEIMDILSKDLGPVILNSDNIFTAMSLFVKRKEFDYEHEVRLIYNHDDSRTFPDVYSYGLDPNDIFDEMVVDPWTDQQTYTQIVDESRALGYTHEISQSDLYAPNKSVIIF